MGIGPWDVTERKIDGAWTHIGEPAFDAFLQWEMELAVDTLSSGGALVVWLTSPRITFGDGDHPISDPARMDRTLRPDGVHFSEEASGRPRGLAGPGDHRPRARPLECSWWESNPH